MTSLSISLVTFHPDEPMLRDTLDSLRIAVSYAREVAGLSRISLTLVDNGDDAGLDELVDDAGWESVRVLSGHGNIGFGRGHNLAMECGMGDLHLVLNPDVYLQSDALINAILFMQDNPECGLLSPAIAGVENSWHFLCKRYPSLFDLLLRGFAPSWLRKLFRTRLEHYEMRDKGGPPVLWDPPIVSGCFMFCRNDVLVRLCGFDPRYFLYFEDFDLSLRVGEISRVAAVGSVRIAHFGGGAARKGFAHIRMFCSSAWLFFSLHGWKWF